MKIPESVKIGGHNIPIRIENTVTLDDPGAYNTYHGIIRIRKEVDIREDIIAETFMHEIIETIKSLNNLGLNHTDLTVISEGLFQVIRDNGLDFRGK